jgi:hypothetical protein
VQIRALPSRARVGCSPHPELRLLIPGCGVLNTRNTTDKSWSNVLPDEISLRARWKSRRLRDPFLID